MDTTNTTKVELLREDTPETRAKKLLVICDIGLETASPEVIAKLAWILALYKAMDEGRPRDTTASPAESVLSTPEGAQ